MTNKAVELMEEWGLSEAERYLYDKNIDNVRIENAIVRGTRRKAMEKGIKEGMEKGIKEGMEKGKAEANKEVAKKMLAAGIDRKTIYEITNIEMD